MSLGTNGQKKCINKAESRNNVINAEGGISSRSFDGITANVLPLCVVAD